MNVTSVGGIDAFWVDSSIWNEQLLPGIVKERETDVFLMSYSLSKICRTVGAGDYRGNDLRKVKMSSAL